MRQLLSAKVSEMLSKLYKGTSNYFSVIAYTDLTVYVLDKTDFKWVFGIMEDDVAGVTHDATTSSLIKKLKGLTNTWKSAYSQFINKNTCFKQISEA